MKPYSNTVLCSAYDFTQIIKANKSKKKILTSLNTENGFINIYIYEQRD